MAIDDKKEQLSGSKTSISRETETPKEKAPAPEPKKEIDTSAWGGNKYLKRESLGGWARSDEAWRKTNLPESERVEISNELFGKSGDYLDKKKGEKTLKGLEKERAYANTDLDRKRIDKEIKVAKSILGK
ncbi:MAG: hypothetical protein NTZ84_00365 [Candidatus Nealsonbacteria bacterium]|nr:hypothetical protein [Candidatus Nealsonbacteria bacterium]